MTDTTFLDISDDYEYELMIDRHTEDYASDWQDIVDEWSCNFELC